MSSSVEGKGSAGMLISASWLGKNSSKGFADGNGLMEEPDIAPGFFTSNGSKAL
jgi:hypothetical protein